MECYCAVKRKSTRHEKPKPQTATVVSLWFCGFLAYPELHCDWSLHNQKFLKFFSSSQFSEFDSNMYDINGHVNIT